MDEQLQNEPASAAPASGGGLLAFIMELIKVAALSVAIILPVRYFLIKPFYVNGASMEPNFFNHEYLIIDEISYRFAEPKRGEVVVFRNPEDEKQYFIKRVIGLPGERVVIKEGRVQIFNKLFPAGTALNEAYLPADLLTGGQIDVTLGSDEFFVLGDNRRASLDSRRFGPLPRREIIGRTWLRGWPPNRIGVIYNPRFEF